MDSSAAEYKELIFLFMPNCHNSSLHLCICQKFPQFAAFLGDKFLRPLAHTYSRRAPQLLMGLRWKTSDHHQSTLSGFMEETLPFLFLQHTWKELWCLLNLYKSTRTKKLQLRRELIPTAGNGQAEYLKPIFKDRPGPQHDCEWGGTIILSHYSSCLRCEV